MDTNDVIEILNNFEPGYLMAKEAAREALDAERFDWADQSENRDPAYYYSAIGERIVDAIKEDAGGLADKYDTLVGLLFSDMLSGLDRRELGQHYYDDVTSQ